jgi:hypothetical protein
MHHQYIHSLYNIHNLPIIVPNSILTGVFALKSNHNIPGALRGLGPRSHFSLRRAAPALYRGYKCCIQCANTGRYRERRRETVKRRETPGGATRPVACGDAAGELKPKQSKTTKKQESHRRRKRTRAQTSANLTRVPQKKRSKEKETERRGWPPSRSQKKSSTSGWCAG